MSSMIHSSSLQHLYTLVLTMPLTCSEGIELWCRERAVSFLASSLSALALMLHELQQQGCDLNSAPLMRSIMQAYALLATAPESFLAVAGQMALSPQHPVLLVYCNHSLYILAVSFASFQHKRGSARPRSEIFLHAIRF